MNVVRSLSPRPTVRAVDEVFMVLFGGATEWSPDGSHFAVNVVQSMISMYIGIVNCEEEHTYLDTKIARQGIDFLRRHCILLRLFHLTLLAYSPKSDKEAASVLLHRFPTL
jgi:hypothetical protein